MDTNDTTEKEVKYKNSILEAFAIGLISSSFVLLGDKLSSLFARSDNSIAELFMTLPIIVIFALVGIGISQHNHKRVDKANTPVQVSIKITQYKSANDK